MECGAVVGLFCDECVQLIGCLRENVEVSVGEKMRKDEGEEKEGKRRKMKIQKEMLTNSNLAFLSFNTPSIWHKLSISLRRKHHKFNPKKKR